MKILQIVTCMSPDGAYGGPVEVALNQAKTLQEMGHDVIIAAAAEGFGGPLPRVAAGVPVQLYKGYRALPGTGFAGMISPGLMFWLARTLRDADVVHVHLARDLITLPAAAMARILRIPVVAQTHGMIDPSSKALARPLDAFLTRPVLRNVQAVLHLTERERLDLQNVAGSAVRFQSLPNGVPMPATRSTEQLRGPALCPEVLYLGRLHRRKRPSLLAYAASALTSSWPNVRFAVVGPDEGEAAGLQGAIGALNVKSHVHWEGALSPAQVLPRMARASVFVLPSIDEPFPMAVLQAMSLGLPVVVTETCGLAPLIQEHTAGLVCDHSAEGFAQAVETLLADTNLRITMGQNARRVVARRCSMKDVGRQLVALYTNAVGVRGNAVCAAGDTAVDRMGVVGTKHGPEA